MIGLELVPKKTARNVIQFKKIIDYAKKEQIRQFHVFLKVTAQGSL